MQLIDLSHDVVEGMTTYPGLPGPVIADFLSWEASRSRYADGTEFQIGQIEMVANTGTYVDSPAHRHKGGLDLSSLSLESLANLDGVVSRVPDGATEIGPEAIPGGDLRGRAVLFATGWSRHWGTDAYLSGHPYLLGEAASALVERGAALVGIDSLNIDSTEDLTRPAHTILLAARIPIVEHLCNLESIPDRGFRFFAVPPKIRGMGTFTVRAFAIAPGNSNETTSR